ncbi:MAG: hypothetical protein IJ794_11635 [Lachnospiraceae bacterium]|nr:hypothetical protein [Lachnospiraceae bacterium]
MDGMETEKWENVKTGMETKYVKEYVIKIQRGGGEDEPGEDEPGENVCRIL